MCLLPLSAVRGQLSARTVVGQLSTFCMANKVHCFVYLYICIYSIYVHIYIMLNYNI